MRGDFSNLMVTEENTTAIGKKRGKAKRFAAGATFCLVTTGVAPRSAPRFLERPRPLRKTPPSADKTFEAVPAEATRRHGNRRPMLE